MSHSSTAARPFAIVGWCAIVAAGVLAASVAHRPSQEMVWMVAYLVLVAGAGQYALGMGQLRLSEKLPSRPMLWLQWLLLNLGHAGVIAGSFTSNLAWVAAATVPYLLALGWFGWRVRGTTSGLLLSAYRLMVLALITGAIIGLVLSVVRYGA